MKMNSNDTRNKASADSKKSFHEHVLSTYHQNALALNKSWMSKPGKEPIV